MNTPTSFAKLIDLATKEHWCTRLLCTTCGSHPFRTALNEIPRDDVIAGLRELSDEFLSKNKDMFRLIIREIAFFNIGGELLEPLAGTPAAVHLQRNIDFINSKYDRRKAYEATQTPEAIASRRSEKKRLLEQLTQPHRDRKLVQDSALQVFTATLNQTSDDYLVKEIFLNCPESLMRSIGGLMFSRLLSHYKKVKMDSTELEKIKLLSEKYSGHWSKLLEKLSQHGA